LGQNGRLARGLNWDETRARLGEIGEENGRHRQNWGNSGTCNLAAGDKPPFLYAFETTQLITYYSCTTTINDNLIF